MKEFDEDYASNLNYLQRFSKEKKRNEYLEIYCIDAWSATDLIENPEEKLNIKVKIKDGSPISGEMV